MLLIHGDDDRNVPFSESVDVAEALRNRGVHVEALVFPDEVHGFLLHRNWMAAFRAAEDFFRPVPEVRAGVGSYLDSPSSSAMRSSANVVRRTRCGCARFPLVRKAIPNPRVRLPDAKAV